MPHLLTDALLHPSHNFVVKRGNYGKCKALDIGDMSVVTNMSHTLVLENVRHVSDLWLYLMYSKKLDDREFSSHFANGAYKLMESLIVARVSKCYNFYRTVLQG